MNKYQEIAGLSLIFLVGFGLRFWRLDFNLISVFGTITILVFYLLVKELTRSKKLSLFSLVFLSLMPWHIRLSRSDWQSTIIILLLTTLILVCANLIKRQLSTQKIFVPLSLGIIFLSNIFSFNLSSLSPVFLGDYTKIGYIGLVLVILGIITYGQRQKSLKDKIFLYWLIIAPGSTLVIPLSFFSAHGLKRITQIKSASLRLASYVLVFFLYIFQLIYFLELYHYH